MRHVPGRVEWFYRMHRVQDFGSDLVFNPLSWIINDSFDTIQLGVHERRLSRRDYRTDGSNLWDNLSHPLDVIEEFGWRSFISQEVFPLSFGTETAGWPPELRCSVNVFPRALWRPNGHPSAPRWHPQAKSRHFQALFLPPESV